MGLIAEFALRNLCVAASESHKVVVLRGRQAVTRTDTCACAVIALLSLQKPASSWRLNRQTGHDAVASTREPTQASIQFLGV